LAGLRRIITRAERMEEIYVREAAAAYAAKQKGRSGLAA
jgi:hypothetical protein